MAGNLTTAELDAAIDSGEIDTVVVAFPDARAGWSESASPRDSGATRSFRTGPRRATTSSRWTST